MIAMESPVREWYQSAPAEFAGMKDALDPGVEFRVCAGWPSGGLFHGHKEVFEDFFFNSAQAWERLTPTVTEVIVAGETTVVRGTYDGVASPTGIPFSAAFVHIWRVRDGKLVSLDQIADTAIIADAVSGKIPPDPS